MAIYKNKDLEVDISFGTSKEINKSASFYTGDKGSASIRITVKHKGFPFNFAGSDMIPTLDLIHSDGSIWLSEPMTVVDGGTIQYNIPNNIMAHAGTISAKLFLKNANTSIHVLNFNIEILDSGIEGVVEKEISVNIVDDAVKRIIEANPEGFKGKDADPNDVKDLLIPYTENRVTEEFNNLSASVQVDSEVILARKGKTNLNERITTLNNGVGVNILDFPRLEGEIDDRNRFQRAIDHLEEVGGGKLVIPKTQEPYELIMPTDTTIQNPYRVKITGDNIEIEGVGLPTILMKGLTHSYLDSIDDLSSSGRDIFTAFAFIGSENCKVSGLRFVGEWDGVGEFRYASPRSIGIGFKGGKNCHVENVHGERILGNVVNFTGAMVAVEGFYKWSENISIINSYAYKNLENGFNFMGTTIDGRFTNNHSIGNGSAGFESATENLVVSDNITKGNKYSGISISGKNYLLSNNVVSDNTCNGELGNKESNGIKVTGGSNGEIINNRVSNSEGFELYVYPGVYNLRINNNTFVHNDNSASSTIVYFSGTINKNINNIEFSGNKITNFSNKVAQCIIGNYFGSAIIANNTIEAGSATHSVYLQSTCFDIKVNSNFVDKPVTLSNSGLNLTSRDNLGENIVKRSESPNEPTSGKWERGDIVDNISKFIGQGHPDRWRCIFSGYANNNPWKSNTNYEPNVLVNNAGKVYKSKKTGLTGNTPPVHVTGSQTDGTQEWEFVDNLAVFEVAGQVGLYQSSSTKPLFKGQLSQSGNRVFIAVGTNSAADWVQLSNN